MTLLDDIPQSLTHRPAEPADEDPARGPVVAIGAGPAGLTAALCLTDHGRDVVVLEATDAVGGISQTVEQQGWRFDIGGHRFFTKVPTVEAFWHRLLAEDDFPVRPRLSRIHYDGKFYDYPLNPKNALRNLGLVNATRCVASYAWARVRPPRDLTTFEGWVQARFGRRLYETFFKTYTEKVWGMPASSIQADWAAQRIKNLSLGRAVLNAFRRTSGSTEITSLIEQFRYPRLGPGMMWEACRDQVVAGGGQVLLGAEVVSLRHDDGRVHGLVLRRGEQLEQQPCADVVSSMPIGQLVERMDPPPPADVAERARALRHRDFLTVALVVPAGTGFPDNWIYIHSPEVRVGRIQNFGSWSPDMVRPGSTCLGLEYFVHEGDDVWSMADDDLIELAKRELDIIGLLDADLVERGFVVRMPKAYPVYDDQYANSVDVLRAWLREAASNVHPVGRNGMHRYNNQDHSMLTAMYAVENIVGTGDHDLWSVNVEDDYHEESSSGGTGRSAPMAHAGPTSASRPRPAGTHRG